MQEPLGQDGRYWPVRRIAAGGMGEIWEADDTLLGRRVAVKLLVQELSSDRAAVRRFGREARATAKLDHPNVTRVFDFIDGTAPLLILELLDGQTLTDRLRHGGAVPPLEAARIAAAVAEGLDAAHRSGIVHRDVKPSNIMLTSSGQVKSWTLASPPRGTPTPPRASNCWPPPATSRPSEWRAGARRPPGIFTRWAWCCTRCSPAGRRSRPRPPSSFSAPISRHRPGRCGRSPMGTARDRRRLRGRACQEPC